MWNHISILPNVTGTMSSIRFYYWLISSHFKCLRHSLRCYLVSMRGAFRCFSQQKLTVCNFPHDASYPSVFLFMELSALTQLRPAVLQFLFFLFFTNYYWRVYFLKYSFQEQMHYNIILSSESRRKTGLHSPPCFYTELIILNILFTQSPTIRQQRHPCSAPWAADPPGNQPDPVCCSWVRQAWRTQTRGWVIAEAFGNKRI